MKATLEVINQMQREGIIAKYAIGGAVGATLYPEPVATLDIDIFVSLTAPSGAALLALSPRRHSREGENPHDYLTSRGYKIDREHLAIEGWPVWFLPPADALEEEALDKAAEVEMEGTLTRVMTAEHLAAIALKTGRAKDFARLLQFVESGVLDAGKLDAILERHGLREKWADFGAKFLR